MFVLDNHRRYVILEKTDTHIHTGAYTKAIIAMSEESTDDGDVTNTKVSFGLATNGM